MKLSIIIPAHNEAASLSGMVRALTQALGDAHIEHEIIVIDDHSADTTKELLTMLKEEIPHFLSIANTKPPGYGYAVRTGLEYYTGDCVAIMMADAADRPEDLIAFFQTMNEGGYDCVFGSRFIQGGEIKGYPYLKFIVNRLGNFLIQTLFGISYNDCTNAFKLYRRKVIDGVQPLIAPHFNLTIELPLKAIIRGYSYIVLPNAWQGRCHGVSHFRIKEFGNKYLCIMLYCLIERYFVKKCRMTEGPYADT